MLTLIVNQTKTPSRAVTIPGRKDGDIMIQLTEHEYETLIEVLDKARFAADEIAGDYTQLEFTRTHFRCRYETLKSIENALMEAIVVAN